MTEKGETRRTPFVTVLIKNELKTNSKNHQKTITKNHGVRCQRLPKWAKIDSKTHKKSMPKLGTKKIIKIIKDHVSLNRKIIEIHCKNNFFDGLEGCMCGR